VKDQPVVLEAEPVEATSKSKRSQYCKTIGCEVQKRTGIVTRPVVGFIHGRRNARALQRDAQCWSANPTAHDYHVLCHGLIVPAQSPCVFLNLAAVLRFLR